MPSRTLLTRAAIATALATPFTFGPPVLGQDEPPATVRAVLDGVRADRAGPVLCALFPGPEGFPHRPRTSGVRRGRSHPDRGRQVCTFRGIPPGTYAVAVHHDFDDDGVLDTNLFGKPSEAWGTTGNVTHSFRAPSFEESAFPVEAGATRELLVRMHY
ncbi:MAG: DUF2141 domain-containing protein [Sandaracinaceae bacterium]